MPVAVFQEVWGPWIDANGRVRAADGGEADLYADLDGETFRGFMMTHFSPGAVLDLLFDFLVAADAVVIPPDRPAMMVREEQRRHLPDLIRAGAVVVRSGDEVGQSIAGARAGDPPGPAGGRNT